MGGIFIDFNLSDKRYRLYNGKKIKLKLNPNSFSLKHRKRQAELLAKRVYDHVVSNNYSFDEDSSSSELAFAQKFGYHPRVIASFQLESEFQYKSLVLSAINTG